MSLALPNRFNRIGSGLSFPGFLGLFLLGLFLLGLFFWSSIVTADPQHPIERLRIILLRRWWRTNLLLWLTVGSLSLWALRGEWAILRQYFTWTAVRYAMAYHRLAALGLGLCIGLTVAILVAESRHILFGLTQAERTRMERLHRDIHAQGERHPLWAALHQRPR